MGDGDRASLLGRSTIVGTSEQIVEALLDIRGTADMNVEFVARSAFPTMSYEDQVALMQQLAEEVAPHI